MDQVSPKPVAEIRRGKIDDIKARLASAISNAREYLFSRQAPEGYWCGELEADTIDAVFQLSVNHYQGSSRQQLIIQHWWKIDD